MSEECTIQVRDDGPYKVTGTFHLEDMEGNAYAVEGKIALCRCGASATKPFCDGAHKAAGFESAPRADD